METYNSFAVMGEDDLLRIDGGVTKAAAGIAAIVAAVAGAASYVAGACGASSLSAGFGTIAGGATLVGGYLALFPAP